MSQDAPRGTVTYYEDTKNEWRWRFQAVNHEVIADSAEGYEHRSDAVNGFNVFCALVGGNPAVPKVAFADEA